MDTKFSADERRQFKDYERVRSRGIFNMFDPRARRATGLNEDEYLFVMNNYGALRDAVAAEKSGSAA